MGLDEDIDGGAQEQEDDQGAHDDADDLEAGQPLLVVPADGLEHGPETVVEVEPDGDEPHHVDGKDPPVTEGIEQQQIRILSLAAHEFAELHLGPEVGEMEGDQAQDDNAQDGHVLGGPGIVLRLGSDLITLHAATFFEVLVAEPASIDDVDEKLINDNLYTEGLADPNLIIRTSGEERLSGFLLWQSSYSELYFCDSLWPELRKIDYLRAIRDYQARDRRFGV